MDGSAARNSIFGHTECDPRGNPQDVLGPELDFGTGAKAGAQGKYLCYATQDAGLKARRYSCVEGPPLRERGVRVRCPYKKIGSLANFKVSDAFAERAYQVNAGEEFMGHQTPSEQYAANLTTPAKAVEAIQNGSTCAWHLRWECPRDWRGPWRTAYWPGA
jgi:hypothetical protein